MKKQIDNLDNESFQEGKEFIEKYIMNVNAELPPFDDEEERNSVDWEDLMLIYRISDHEGWYMNKDDECFYVVKNEEKREFKVTFAKLLRSELNILISQVFRTGQRVQLYGEAPDSEKVFLEKNMRVSRMK
jgi:hypothetical protein